MAVGIWLTVRREAEPSAAQALNITENTYGNVPVLAISANTNVRAVQLEPQSVKVMVSGPSETMDNLNASQVHAFVNLTDLGPVQNLPQDVEISLPPGATVVDVEPPQVAVTIPKQP